MLPTSIIFLLFGHLTAQRISSRFDFVLLTKPSNNESPISNKNKKFIVFAPPIIMPPFISVQQNPPAVSQPVVTTNGLQGSPYPINQPGVPTYPNTVQFPQGTQTIQTLPGGPIQSISGGNLQQFPEPQPVGQYAPTQPMIGMPPPLPPLPLQSTSQTTSTLTGVETQQVTVQMPVV